MKFKTKNKIRNLLITTSLLAVSIPALALKTDTSQPMTITSDNQAVDINSNTVTLTGNVVVKQGSILVHADRATIVRPNGQSGKEVVEGFGNPVTFFQMQDNGKPIKGHALKVRYEVDKDLITLTGDAYLEQLDSNVQGDRITYLVQQQQMQAFSDKGKRVTTVLVPSQLQQKTPAAAGQKKSN
ncbi:lipopolysaccharide ABC transporter substrate-binding protein LptA [Rouxiella silvae]|uniref:Lipopolysaccharide export system protein LptA n=1 Tax=Rouxiella silvae TaxID=1646373 RepID=A0AA40X6Z0_9GAMM|nr:MULTISPECIES: lipopolysaccharide ABC transporter substrate-binding protein LptA [Rouxiella]KAB7898569.1 lipopolysaccharide ABC transporter substrate-binding protein LptA [Rouxiella sp. S1S-2]KQN49233.1 lipopolysaccharide transport periplasmic protein LptA [Serratia sp. Leaf50]MBF6639392.1 lipopolysaccharide ABC transporter substrate-binding protein LptA [Rouxiella silvae]ORJ21086.1 lipopolysaccharide ABC transporter substrate-binding protein LptA [Rouxiella silvae]